MYNRIARVEHVDHARRSAQHCIQSLLTAKTHTYVGLHICSLIFRILELFQLSRLLCAIFC